MNETMRAGIGTSNLDDASLAGRQAAERALGHISGRRPDLMIVYSSVRYDLPAMLAGIRDVAGDVPLVGATSCGQMHDGDVTPPGEGLAVLALVGGYRFGVSHVSNVSADPQAAGRELAHSARRAAAADDMPYHALLVLSDGLIADNQGLLNGVYRITGFAVPVVGGAAGDDRRLLGTSVFCGDEVLRDAAVAVWIGAPRRISVACAGGWTPEGLPLMVTSVDGPVVREIDGRSGAAVYRENLGPDGPGGLNAAHLGLIEPDGSLLVRAAFIGSDGELHTFTPLPEYSAVRIVRSRPDDLLDVDSDAVASVLNGFEASVVLAFSCVARLDVLGPRGPEEAQRLQKAAGGIPTFGFYTYGEFARTTSVAGYHNATMAVVAL